MLKNFLKPKMSNLELVNLLNNIKEKPRKPYGSGSHLQALEKFCDRHSVSKNTNEGFLPLHVALEIIPEEEVVQVFLNCGAPVNAQDKLGFTALHHASTKGNPSLIDQLLSHRANPNLRTYTSTSACQMSLQLLFDGKQLLDTEYVENCMEICCKLIDVTDTIDILEHSWDGNALTRGTTVLHDAARLKLLKVVQKLLQKGVRVDEHDNYFQFWWEAIMHSAMIYEYNSRYWKESSMIYGRKDRFKILKLLLEHGGNPSERIINPTRYLLDGAPNSKIEKLLKSYGAKRSKKDPYREKKSK